MHDTKRSVIQLYRTGDLGRYLPNGDIEYLGRVDQQVKLRGFRIELGAIKHCLMQHERVAQAVIVLDDSSQEKRILAYIVPKPSPQKDSTPELSKQHNQRWQQLYDRLYASKQTLDNPWFNTTGWNSSYTGEPIAIDAMQAWVNSTVERILALSPKKVLEIGCGTGLLLSQIAPHTQFYHATDFSAQAIEYIQASLERAPIAHNKLQLTCRAADEIGPEEKACYDVVIINSVVQYFPDQNYLLQVLSKALDSVSPGGYIFVGDVRSLAHINLFHALTLLSKETPIGTAVSLRQAIAQKHAQEAELVLDPQIFKQFAVEHKNKISSTRIEIKSSPFQDEMATFRYNVVLSIANTANIISENKTIQWLDWSTIQPVDSDGDKNTWKEASLKINSFLKKATKGYLAIKQIPNKRLHDLAEFLRYSLDFSLKASSVAWKEKLQSLQGVDQSWIYQIATDNHFNTYVTWSTSNPLTHFDVIFYKNASKQILETITSPFSQVLPENKQALANNPLSLEDKNELSRLLKKHLKHYLPEYMHPQAIIGIDTIPVTRNGKIDFSALPKIQTRSVLSTSNTDFDPIEKSLAKLWEDLLSVHNLCLEDDFFDLGGHSLIAIQMLYAVEQTFAVNIPIHQLFGASSLNAFAQLVRTYLIDKQMQATGMEYKPHEHSPIITLSSKGDKTPCFFFHPIGGSVFPYIPLVRELNIDRPYYAIQDPGIYAKQPLFTSIEDMVSHYIQHIRTIQPKGPYLLAGASMGGMLAIEAAAQLMKEGERIEMIAMFDAWGIFTEKFCDKKRLENGMMRQYEVAQIKLDKALIPNPEVWLDINYHRLQQMLNYKLPIVNEKVILFKCQELFAEFIPIDCPDNYWSHYALQGVEIHNVPGNHETMMIEPNVKQIAIVLNQVLSAIGKNTEEKRFVKKQRKPKVQAVTQL